MVCVCLCMSVCVFVRTGRNACVGLPEFLVVFVEYKASVTSSIPFQTPFSRHQRDRNKTTQYLSLPLSLHFSLSLSLSLSLFLSLHFFLSLSLPHPVAPFKHLFFQY